MWTVAFLKLRSWLFCILSLLLGWSRPRDVHHQVRRGSGGWRSGRKNYICHSESRLSVRRNQVKPYRSSSFIHVMCIQKLTGVRLCLFGIKLVSSGRWKPANCQCHSTWLCQSLHLGQKGSQRNPRALSWVPETAAQESKVRHRSDDITELISCLQLLCLQREHRRDWSPL